MEVPAFAENMAEKGRRGGGEQLGEKIVLKCLVVLAVW